MLVLGRFKEYNGSFNMSQCGSEYTLTRRTTYWNLRCELTRESEIIDEAQVGDDAAIKLLVGTTAASGRVQVTAAKLQHQPIAATKRSSTTLQKSTTANAETKLQAFPIAY